MTRTEPVRDEDQPHASRVRRLVFNIVQVVFLIAAVVFAAFSLRGQWPDIVRDVSQISIGEFLTALAALFAGFFAFGLMWIRVLAGFGFRVPLIKGLGIFFVGQLGRYIPGSVWSFGAQAAMARSAKVPPRVTVITGLTGLGFSLATAGAVGMLAVAGGLLPISVSPLLAVAVCIAILVVLFSPVVNLIGTKIAGKSGVLKLRGIDTLVIVALLLTTWLLDGLALFVLSGEFRSTPAHWLSGMGTMVGAYGLSYVVGVVIIFAPAGLGARELALTWLLTPALGLTSAAALAIVSRVPITITDFVFALLFGLLGRRGIPHDQN
jgi:hypothetical protein